MEVYSSRDLTDSIERIVSILEKIRVYDHGTHTDYKIAAEDIQVEIVADNISFYEEDGNNRLDWSSEYLKRARPDAT